jgi:hypothetical protein
VGYAEVDIKYRSTKVFLVFFNLISPVVMAFTFDALIFTPARARRLRYATSVLQDKIPLAEVVVDLNAAQRQREAKLLRQSSGEQDNSAQQQARPSTDGTVEAHLENGALLQLPNGQPGAVRQQERGTTLGEPPGGAEAPKPRNAASAAHPLPPSPLPPTLACSTSSATKGSGDGRCYSAPSLWLPHGKLREDEPIHETGNCTWVAAHSGSRSRGHSYADNVKRTLAMDDRDGLFSPRTEMATAGLKLPSLAPSGNSSLFLSVQSCC